MLKKIKVFLLGYSCALLALIFSTSAQALPSYARQTGQDCASCHVGAFGPQLNPFGMQFKLNGYVDSDNQSGKIPLSAMLVAGHSRFRSDQDRPAHRTQLSEASIFLAGKLTEHIGSFVQVTHDGTAQHNSIDQMDIRYARSVSLGGKDSILGLSLNNNPTVTDPLNTLFVWAFPYTSSPYSYDMGNAGLKGLGDQIAGRVLGLNGYTLIDNRFYAEVGVYNTLNLKTQSRLGLYRADGLDYGYMHSAPYWRLAYMRDLRTTAWSVGVFGFNGKTIDYEAGDTKSKFRDLGVDASYQFLGNRRHIATLNARYTREHLKETEEARNTLTDYRLSASYTFLNTYSFTFGSFYSSNQNRDSGNRGTVYQMDWTPWGKESSPGPWSWANLRIGLQYVRYKSYIDAVTDENGNVLGYGPNLHPSHKNNLHLFLWTSF